MMVLALMMTLPSAALAAEGGKPLVVASTTQMSGNFTTNMWGNNTSDVDMRLLLHGYPTVYENLDQQYEVNEVVLINLTTRDENDGGKTFSFKIKPGLRYNDGSPITAKDYVFSVLLSSSPYIEGLGGSPIVFDYIKGAQDYAQDPTKPFAGVRLLGDMSFSLTITPESFPHANEMIYALVQPYPYQVIVPGSDIKDDGQGAYVSGQWTLDVLMESMLNPETGYLSHPMVTSGPYSLVSYDPLTGRAEMEINPNFQGNPYGQKPTIQRLVYEPIANKDIITKLKNGEVDLINKATARSVTDAAAQDASLQSVEYEREGMAYLLAATEKEVMSTVGVRKAVAYSLDVPTMIDQFIGGKGFRVSGFYGLVTARSPEFRAQINRIPVYNLNQELALQAVVDDGFILNELGEPYDEKAGGIRHRQGAAGLIPLSITLGITPDNPAADIVARQLEQNLPKIGAQFNLAMLNMPSLLKQYYRQGERTSDLLFLGSNFMKDFTGNPAGYSAESFDMGNNPAALVDKQLSDLSVSLRRTANNRNAYVQIWRSYQTRLAEILPIIPLYTNIYTDIYSDLSGLTDYHPENYWSWGEAILYAHR